VIYLVRHGRTALNAAGCLQGRVDEPLDEVGIRQATGVARRLMDEAPEAQVWSSPLRRARETAALLVGERSDDTVQIDERWIELDYGVLDGVPVGDVPATTWESWRTDPTFRPQGGESFGELNARVHAACEAIRATWDGGDLVIVSHVSPIKSAVAWALGADPSVAHRSRLDQAAVCRIDIGRQGPVLVGFNERW
jgi:alpha-ribazole phosphatase